jgi:predicted dehydrogenase
VPEAKRIETEFSSMNVIHIGAGVRGRHWLEIVRDHSDITSVGCVDPEAAALDWVRTHFPELRNSCYENLGEALTRIDAHTALIASPVSHHGAHCMQALEAGLAVMVEKPFTSNIEEALQAAERAEILRKPVVVAQNYRFIPVERTLRYLIRDERVGRVISATCISRRRRPGKGTFLGTMDYPQLIDVGVHHFDSLRSILGLNAVAISCRVSNPPWSDYRHGAITQALIEMERDVNVQYLGTLTSHSDEYRLWVEGDRGVLYTDRRRVWWRKRAWRFLLPVRKVSVPKGDELPYPREGTTSLLDSLKAAVLNGAEPETGAHDNLQTLAMVEAGKRSAEEGRRVMIREILQQTSERATDSGAALALQEETPVP